MRLFNSIAAIAFLSPCAVIAQETIEGRMICEVQSNTVVEIEDGRVTTYAGYTDSFEAGDSLVFEYQLQPLGRGGSSLWLSFVDKRRDQMVWSTVLFPEDITLPVTGNTVSFEAPANQLGAERGSFGLDYIRSRGPTKELRMLRYYRSDWQAIMTGFTFEGVQTFTLDCRHSGPDNVEVLFGAMQAAAN